MPEKINENIFKEEAEPLEKKPSADFEFSTNSETEQLASNISSLTDAINHDGVVKLGDLEKIEKNLGEIKIDFGGEQFTVEEIKNIPDIKENVNIWKEIVGGNFNNAHKLTHITPKIAKHLLKYQRDLYLSGLTTISDTSAEYLSKHSRGLDLGGLTNISDTSAEHLSRHQGYLCLYGLTNISDVATKCLSKHPNLRVKVEIREMFKKYKQ